MFPGFISTYKDDNEYIHLYFFPGLDDNFNGIYKNLDLSKCNFEYKITTNEDKSVDYKFLNKKIKRIHCKLLFVNSDKENLLSLYIQ